MTQDEQQTAVAAIFDSRAAAEDAIVALHQEGLDMKRLSIFGRDCTTKQHTSGSAKIEKFLVLVHGTAEMIVHARAILGTTGSSHLETHTFSHGSHIATGLGLS
jgi:hypothetical protein